MTVKTTQEDLQALELIIKAGLHIIRPVTMEDKLVCELVHNVYDRIVKRLKKVQYGNKTSGTLDLKSLDARALFCWWRAVRDRLEGPYKYESLIMNKIYGEIDRIYG